MVVVGALVVVVVVSAVDWVVDVVGACVAVVEVGSCVVLIIIVGVVDVIVEVRFDVLFVKPNQNKNIIKCFETSLS